MNVDELRKKILDPSMLPYTHQILDVQRFLNDNQQFFNKLKSITQKQIVPALNKRKSKSVSKFSVARESNITNAKPLSILKQRNEHLVKLIKRMQDEENQKHFHGNPKLQDQKMQVQQKSKQAQILAELNKQLKQVISQKSDMFQMYEKMCRRCQKVRKLNNQASQQIKQSIKKLNQLTGKDQNPNLFIMNFK